MPPLSQCKCGQARRGFPGAKLQLPDLEAPQQCLLGQVNGSPAPFFPCPSLLAVQG